MITGGTIKYGETRKMADFENKRADVELSFNLPDEVMGATEVSERIREVSGMAKNQCLSMFRDVGMSPALAAPFKNEATLEPTKPHSRRAPKMPVQEVPPAENTASNLRNDAAAILEEAVTQVIPDLDLAPGVTLITDAEIMDAVSKRQQEVRNPVSVRKLLADVLTSAGVKCPPGRVVDIPQDKRQEFLDGLKLIKPLA